MAKKFDALMRVVFLALSLSALACISAAGQKIRPDPMASTPSGQLLFISPPTVGGAYMDANTYYLENAPSSRVASTIPEDVPVEPPGTLIADFASRPRRVAGITISVAELYGQKVKKPRKVCTHPARYDAWDRVFRPR